VARPVDKEGNTMLDHGDEARFMEARNGDNLSTPFQCDLCHFRNVMGRDPEGGLPQDLRVLKLI